MQEENAKLETVLGNS